MRVHTRFGIHLETLKPIVWMGRSRADMKALPADTQQELGHQLLEVQRGNAPRHWKPMRNVGPGVAEIRVQASGAFRLMYVATFAKAVYVLHVFEKKRQKTSPLDLALARARYSLVLRIRQER